MTIKTKIQAFVTKNTKHRLLLRQITVLSMIPVVYLVMGLILYDTGGVGVFFIIVGILSIIVSISTMGYGWQRIARQYADAAEEMRLRYHREKMFTIYCCRKSMSVRLLLAVEKGELTQTRIKKLRREAEYDEKHAIEQLRRAEDLFEELYECYLTETRRLRKENVIEVQYYPAIDWLDWCPEIERCNGEPKRDNLDDASYPCYDLPGTCWLYTNVYLKLKPAPNVHLKLKPAPNVPIIATVDNAGGNPTSRNGKAGLIDDHSKIELIKNAICELDRNAVKNVATTINAIRIYLGLQRPGLTCVACNSAISCLTDGICFRCYKISGAVAEHLNRIYDPTDIGGENTDEFEQ